MQKNKMLMFDIETGFIAEGIYFSGTPKSLWCLTLASGKRMGKILH